jgi:hypothetical protein
MAPAPVDLLLTTTTNTDKGYENALRPELAKKSILHKIRIFGAMHESDKGLPTSSFTPSYRTLYYAKVKPVGLYLIKCFGEDAEKFEQRLEKLPNKGSYVCCSLTKYCSI